MAELHIKDIDSNIIDNLKQLAQSHNHSLDTEIKLILEQAITYQSRRQNFYKRSQLLRRRIAQRGIAQTDSAQMLREDRDR
jgi:antitoxin FitA